jgi:hypothetical protein
MGTLHVVTLFVTIAGRSIATICAFRHGQRGATDLNTLTVELLAVVQERIQPESLGLRLTDCGAGWRPL